MATRATVDYETKKLTPPVGLQKPLLRSMHPADDRSVGSTTHQDELVRPIEDARESLRQSER
jgi:hypothetical protein